MSHLMDMLLKVGSAGRQPDGSVTRSGFSPQYFEAVEAARELMEQVGLKTSVDPVGNLKGVLKGSDPDAKAIMIGSHLDTVKNGGLYDGVYGVVAGIDCIRRIKESGSALAHSLEVWGFNAEEAGPMGGTFGSRAITGLVDLQDGALAGALEQCGHSIADVVAARVDDRRYQCYLELHIEQGDRLFRQGVPIGVVSGIVGIARYKVTALGESNHSGTTMMCNRKDAMVAMAKLVTAMDEHARQLDDTLVLTVGSLNVYPGADNVIPGRVEASVELRHMDSAVFDRMMEDAKQIAAQIKTVEFSFQKIIEKGSVTCNEGLISSIAGVCREQRIPHIVMPSGAGHDANAIAHCMPVGMIFVPNKDGISHSGLEWTDETDLQRGADILLHTILKLDQLG